MGRPSTAQIAEAIIHSARSGESDAEFDERIGELSRQSDEELAAMGIFPRSSHRAEERVCKAKTSFCREMARAGSGRCKRPVNVTAARDASDYELRNPPPDPDPDPDPAPDPADPDPLAFDPAAMRHRHDGWTAERQRAFIAALAETGCVSEACAEVGITARSAYRLREHAAAASFRAAWGHAESMATARLTALAFERAVHGSVESIYRDGVLVEERRKPSDKLLMWLLSHRDPVGYGWLERPPREAPDTSFYPHLSARNEMPGLLDQLSDIDPAACRAEPVPCSDVDYDAPSPRA